MDAYQQQGRLGEGSHGQVLKAQHLPSGRVVALKQLPLHDYTRRLLELEQDAEALTAMAMSRQAGSRRQDGIAVDEQEDEHDEDQEDRGPATDRMKPQPFVINHHLQPHGMHPLSVFREIMALKRLRHENIVQLYDVVMDPPTLTLVFEYMTTDLGRVIRQLARQLTEPQIKCISLMMLQGLDFCHRNGVMHRDMKPANLLFAHDGTLKIADFGLARLHRESPTGEASDAIHAQRPLYSHQVATRWYRSPELLYGAREYGFGVDLWAAGCIIAELINLSPLFPGQNDIDQLSCVLNTLGTPDENEWPEMHTLPDFNKIIFPLVKPTSWEDIVPNASPGALLVLQKLIVYSSARRATARQALLDEYFFLPPYPVQHTQLPMLWTDPKYRKPDEDTLFQFLYE